jgi:hypothetical protein
MSDYSQRKPAGNECPPKTDNPADQPKPPGKDCKPDLPETTPPDWSPPDKCVPDPDCNCPSVPPSSGPTCLQELIDSEQAEITAAERAKTFIAEMSALLTKAKAAALEYNQPKYEKLVKQWQDADGKIADLLRKLACALPCWRCVVECYVCPLIYDLCDSEQRLYDGDWKNYFKEYKVHDLYDLQYWHNRDLEYKKQRLQRIKDVLATWEKPAQTIDKNLMDNDKVIEACNKALAVDPSSAVYDVFFKVVPMHLAIAPPATSAALTTRIDEAFTEFCKCDKCDSDLDDCCGPDVGRQPWVQRLIGPQPYLINPDAYFDVICCLVKNRYLPAKDQVAKAEANFQSVDNEIKRRKAQLDDAPKSFEKTAKGAIPSNIDCCKFEKDEGDAVPKASARR